ncbi:hypothetical protein FSY75_35230 [Streptomyces sp. TR1341]|uniref:hypothetical protein n=1 Tax=Streptomyces sp. TR1341 TaxID=2601266 RepID=UPI00138AE180|nr:hypothetical protein [Streptomyces sp. TR1341]
MVSYGKRGRVAYVTLDRPAVLNAMSLQLPEQLSRTRADFGQGEDIWVGAPTGTGDRSFSVGQDPRQ